MFTAKEIDLNIAIQEDKIILLDLFMEEPRIQYKKWEQGGGSNSVEKSQNNGGMRTKHL